MQVEAGKPNADTERLEKPMTTGEHAEEFAGKEGTTEDVLVQRAEIDTEQPAEGTATGKRLEEPCIRDDDDLREPEETLKQEGEQKGDLNRAAGRPLNQTDSSEQKVFPAPQELLKTTGDESSGDISAPEQSELSGEKVSHATSCTAPNDDDKKLSHLEVQRLFDELNRSKHRLATTNALLLSQSSNHGHGAALAGFPQTAPPPLGGFPPHNPMNSMAFHPMATIMGQQQYTYYQNPYLAPPFHVHPPPHPPMSMQNLAQHQPFGPLNPLLHQERAFAAQNNPHVAMSVPPMHMADAVRKHATKRATTGADRKMSQNIADKIAAMKARVVGEMDLICVPLACPTDPDHLSPFQCTLRHQIELFEASREDAFGNAQGRNKPILVGQVGIRCRHCYSFYEPGSRKPRGSIYFPTCLSGLYQAAQNMATNHFFELNCKYIPDSEMEELNNFKSERAYKVGGGKGYWSMGGEMKGVCEFQERLWFSKDADSDAETSPTKLSRARSKSTRTLAVQVKAQVQDQSKQSSSLDDESRGDKHDDEERHDEVDRNETRSSTNLTDDHLREQLDSRDDTTTAPCLAFPLQHPRQLRNESSREADGPNAKTRFENSRGGEEKEAASGGVASPMKKRPREAYNSNQDGEVEGEYREPNSTSNKTAALEHVPGGAPDLQHDFDCPKRPKTDAFPSTSMKPSE